MAKKKRCFVHEYFARAGSVYPSCRRCGKPTPERFLRQGRGRIYEPSNKARPAPPPVSPQPNVSSRDA